MSNYPPGVTGFEPQIAGYPTEELELECDMHGCTFKDYVEADLDGYDIMWTCPLCDYDHFQAHPNSPY